MQRLALFRQGQATAKPGRAGARPRWCKYNRAGSVYDARRSEYERQRLTYEAALPDAIGFPMITSMTGKSTGSSSRATTRGGASAGACPPTTSWDRRHTRELGRMPAPEPTNTASPGRGTMHQCLPTSGSGTDAIDAGGMTILVGEVPRALLQFKRHWALSSKRDRVSSFEDTQLACLAWGRHHPHRASPPDPGGWRSSTEGSDHATAICAGGGMLGGGVRRRQ